MIELSRNRRLELAQLHDDTLHALVGAANLGDARREPFEQLVVLVGDDRAHRVADRAVVDRVGQRIARTGPREVDEELQIDLEVGSPGTELEFAL